MNFTKNKIKVCLYYLTLKLTVDLSQIEHEGLSYDTTVLKPFLARSAQKAKT